MQQEPATRVRLYVRQLWLRTQIRHGSCVIAGSEAAKLARLFEKYGIEADTVNSVNSANSGGETETPSVAQSALFT